VTNNPDAARVFYEACGRHVIFKGASNVMTFAQILTPEMLPRLELLPHCPTLFQEYVAGADYRVHVIGRKTFVTRLIAEREDYRRSALADDSPVRVEPARLAAKVLARCVRFTRRLGLHASGIDFKESPRGRLVALELNPYPQFTFYEGRSGQPLIKAVIDYLTQCRTRTANVFA
jgi:glutathione synthase/RimK-type ligase-like ATP-grasp enzyme